MRKVIGRQMQNSTKIEKLLNEIVSEVGGYSQCLQGVQPPIAEEQVTYQEMLERVAQTRGRPLHYPYIGSGIGRGPYVELEDGSVKLDFINGIGIHLLGHSHPRVIKGALKGALMDVVNQGNLEPNMEYTRMVDRVVGLAKRKSRIKFGWLATCGTMANENALKIARQKTSPARKVIAFYNAFAGRSTLMAEITDNPSYKVGLPNYEEVLRIPFYDKKDPKSSEVTLSQFKNVLEQNKGNICAFMFEPMQGEGGYNAAPREFFLPLLNLCRENKIPVWLDEVQTFTRTGEFFAFETLDIGEYVDLCTIAKTAQVGMTLYTEEMNPKPGLIAGTYSGSTAALTAGLEILDLMEKGSFFGPDGKIQKIYNRFVGLLNDLNEKTCKNQLRDAGGLGLMIAVTPLDGTKAKVDTLCQNLFKEGLIAFPCGKDPYRIRFLIPASVEDQDLVIASKIIEKSILDATKEIVKT